MNNYKKYIVKIVLQYFFKSINEINKQTTRIENNKNENLVEIIYMFYDGYD